jgi:hypothetical protein
MAAMSAADYKDRALYVSVAYLVQAISLPRRLPR